MKSHLRRLLVTLLIAAAGLSAPALARAPAREVDIATAYTQQLSNVVVETRGVVQKSLPDDTQPPRHQRFLLRLASGRSVLIAHNIDLAPRVPVQVGKEITVRGEFVWNNKGGLVHWTHHDPSGRHAGGWMRLDGQTYR